MIRRILVYLFAILILSGSVPAFAQPKEKAEVDVEVRRKEIIQGIEKAWRKNHDFSDVEKFLKSKGIKEIQKLTGGDDYQALSVKGNVTYFQPYAFFDRLTSEWTVYSGWIWQETGLQSPTYYWGYDGLSCSPTAMGGPDAAGLWFETTTGLQLKSYMLNTYDNAGQLRINQPTADDWNSNGVAFVDQDSLVHNGCFVPMLYDWHEGYVYTFWRADGGHATTAVKFRLGHTWSSTSISGVSVGLSDISISFSSSQNQWNGTASPYYWSY